MRPFDGAAQRALFRHTNTNMIRRTILGRGQ
jgi:hypothetical protein